MNLIKNIYKILFEKYGPQGWWPLLNLGNVQRVEMGTDILLAAESGAENALMRLLRNPNYSGETFTVDQATVTITVNGSSIVSSATDGKFTRKIQVDTVYTNNILAVSSWREIF